MYPVSTREQALKLLRSGCSQTVVSKRLGISRTAIREWRDRGVEPKLGRNPCFRCEPDANVLPDADYSALLGYYLGDGCISRMRRTYALRVSCDANQTGIILDVAQLIQRVPQRSKVCQVKAPGVIVVQNYWNHWPCVFPQHGPGRKHERKLTLDAWQRELVEAHPADFLRDLFHSDDIRAWCTDALDLLDIPWRQHYWKTIAVSRREGVARLDELIGLKS